MATARHQDAPGRRRHVPLCTITMSIAGTSTGAQTHRVCWGTLVARSGHRRTHPRKDSGHPLCEGQQSSTRAISRRTILKGLAGAALAGGIAAVVGEEVSSAPGRNPTGERPYSFAGHLHSSFSEDDGSTEAQAVQARINRLDSVAMTEHDWRMLHEACRPGFPFTAMSITEADGTWQLTRATEGHLGSASRATTDVASTYPSGGALVMTATTDGGTAVLKYALDCLGAVRDYRGSVGGRTISVDAFAELPSSADAYLAFVTELSLHPSIGDETLRVHYRLNTDTDTKRYSVTGNIGHIEVPATVGKLVTITPDPAVDFPKLWPDVDPFDNSFFELSFMAASAHVGATAQGWFSNLRFVNDPSYDAKAALHAQQAVAARAFSRYAPSVLLIPGCELSRGVHVRQLDGSLMIADYAPSPLPHLRESTAFTTNMVSQIHEHNSTAVLCHPFGTGTEAIPPLMSGSQQDRQLATVSAQLSARKVYGVDAIEAGYQSRNGVDIEHHQMLWHVLSRQGHVLTADGVSDDHTGRSWATQTNRFITYLWAKRLSTSHLTRALSTGRAYVGELSSFSGQLDLWFDDLAAVMGQVSLLSGGGSSTRTLWVRADELPARSQVKVWRAPIDYTDGSHDSHDGIPNDGSVLLGGSPLAASRFEGGPVSITVDTSTSCYFWVDVLDASGRTIAFSNMIYQLRERPPDGAPGLPSSRIVRA
jgi:hypothetical protein